MRAAIYGRFSTSKQDAASLEGQERVCRQYAERHGLTIVDVYTDAAISGSSTARDGLKRLLADAKARRFKAVLVPDLSRLSRDRVDSGVLVRDLGDLGIKVIDVETGADSDDESSDTIFAVKGIVNAEYIKAVRIATHRQLHTRALGGFHAGGRAFGYTSVEEPNPADPTKPRHKLIIDKAESEIVRRIFKMAAEGDSPRKIANVLNTEKIAAPHDKVRGFKVGKGWGFTTVRAMLLNRRYIGETIWNAFRWKKTARGTRRRIPRPASEHVKDQRPELAIIDAATWERVQGRYRARKPRTTESPRPRAVQPRHVLTGLLTCGTCNGTFGVIFTRKVGDEVYRTLGCITRKDRGASMCSNGKTISDRKAVRKLTTHLRERMSRPDRVAKFVEVYRERFRKQVAKGADPTAEIQGKIEKALRTVQSVTEAMILAPTSKALADRLRAEESALEDLQAQLATLRPKRAGVEPHPAAIAAYVEKLADIVESGDFVRSGSILRSALAPFKMVWTEATESAPAGYKMAGALNLALPDLKSSGGPLRFPS
jgi:DNA invertase Pin-like site-specific DNA recombinase